MHAVHSETPRQMRFPRRPGEPARRDGETAVTAAVAIEMRNMEEAHRAQRLLMNLHR